MCNKLSLNIKKKMEFQDSFSGMTLTQPLWVPVMVETLQLTVDNKPI